MTVDNLKTFLKTYGISLLNGIITLAIGLVLIHWSMKLIKKGLDKTKVEPTMKGFLVSVIQVLLYLVLVLTVVNALGIPLTSVITVIASAGVAISLAMQGALTNMVGGMTLLLLKPIKAGEYISVNDVDGTVQGIGVFYTDLVTPDRRHVSMPNSTLVNTAIINFTREGTRRMDVPFSVSYKASVAQVRQVLMDVVASCGTVLPDPEPQVVMTGCEDSAISIVLRLYCRSSDYLNTLYYLNEHGKKALDEAGIEIPYPQMDIHIKNQEDHLS